MFKGSIMLWDCHRQTGGSWDTEKYRFARVSLIPFFSISSIGASYSVEGLIPDIGSPCLLAARAWS